MPNKSIEQKIMEDRVYLSRMDIIEIIDWAHRRKINLYGVAYKNLVLKLMDIGINLVAMCSKYLEEYTPPTVASLSVAATDRVNGKFVIINTSGNNNIVAMNSFFCDIRGEDSAQKKASEKAISVVARKMGKEGVDFLSLNLHLSVPLRNQNYIYRSLMDFCMGKRIKLKIIFIPKEENKAFFVLNNTTFFSSKDCYSRVEFYKKC